MDSDGQTWRHICYTLSNVWSAVDDGSDTWYRTGVEVTSHSRPTLEYPVNVVLY